MRPKAVRIVNHPAAGSAVQADELHGDRVDGFIGRNQEALNASIRRSRDELARGVSANRSIGDIIADGRKRHGAA